MNIITEASFKTTHQGKPVALYTLKNKNGVIVQVTNYGAIVVSIYVPDRNGVFADIVQGYDTIAEYINGNGAYMGGVCGRTANRIKDGKFTLEGKQYVLNINNGTNCNHGGNVGFNKAVWDVTSASPSKVTMEYFSKDGEEGYPGNLKTIIAYSLNDNNEFSMEYIATTDKTTIVGLTNHGYYNLAGEGSGTIYNQELMINGLYFTPVDESSAPTGEIRSVKGTPMDFTKPEKIGTNINANDEQIRIGVGYDHCWVLKNRVGELGLAAAAYDPQSGRIMEVSTTQPGVQLYTANWFDGEKGKGGKPYHKHGSFCLETMHFADSINKPHFPSTILHPGETYNHKCVHKFSVK